MQRLSMAGVVGELVCRLKKKETRKFISDTCWKEERKEKEKEAAKPSQSDLQLLARGD